MIAASLMAGALATAWMATDCWTSDIKAQLRTSARRYDLPVAWITAVMDTESGGCLDARRSKAGAIGIMQLMQPAWSDVHHRLPDVGPSIDSPGANIAAGVAYLRMMFDRFGYPGAFAAYNAGPRRYRDSLHGRVLPSETRRYVAAVLAKIANGVPDEERADALEHRPLRIEQDLFAIIVGRTQAVDGMNNPARAMDTALFVPLD